MDFSNKVYGSILGLAIGDAFGASVEFKKRNTYPKVTDYQSGGEFNLKAGQWTDDTTLALCILESINRLGEFNLHDQMNNFLKWWHQGFLSSTGFCFDIGNTTKAALDRYQKENVLFAGKPSDSASNGAIMRLAPVPIFFHKNLKSAITQSVLHTKTTHAAIECLEASALFAYVLYFIFEGKTKNEILKFIHFEEKLTTQVDDIKKGMFKNKTPEEISGQGSAICTLEAAFYAFYKFDNFYDGLVFVVNLGDDTDTVGAVYGQIAGAYYGIDHIPKNLKDNLYDFKMIEEMTTKFLELIK
jgi:ADP-ribosyl-[dinitrogen reductase] hydrolase